tara:strand:- start:1139 stop:1693 length:555 start_codon:yes stop_codon:yes gene_type:complete
MVQKRYNMELDIIETLLRKENHVRGIAKNLSESHSTVSRKLDNLKKRNVIDFREEGKNKLYFLKKTVEAKAFVYMSESYKLFETLKKYPELRNVVERIQKNNGVTLAVLFGSYAKHIAREKSDNDVYIETGNKEIKRELEKIDSKLNVKIGKYNKNNLLIKEIERNHVIIKGIEEFYEKNGFFE